MKNLNKIENYLNDNYDFCYNTVKDVFSFKSKKSSFIGYRDLDDFSINNLIRELNKIPIYTNKNTFYLILRSNFTKPYNPFENYFNSLPLWKDGDKDYVQLLIDTVKTTNQDWPLYLKIWLASVYKCAIDDNHTNQQVLVLVGEQGLGKSTWLKKLCPEKLNKYRFEGTINPNNKDDKFKLSDNLFVNFDELESINVHSAESIKQFITLSTVYERRPYAKEPVLFPRRASFTGSANTSEFLKDVTGSRRFLCVEALNIDINHDVNMDNVFSQIKYMIENELVMTYFNRELNERINLNNQHFTHISTEQEIIQNHFKICQPDEEHTENVTVFELQQILVGLGYSLNNLRKENLGKALIALGSKPRKDTQGKKRHKLIRINGNT